MRITHTRSRCVASAADSGLFSLGGALTRTFPLRYIYDLYYKREAISKELYDWLLKQEYADAK